MRALLAILVLSLAFPIASAAAPVPPGCVPLLVDEFDSENGGITKLNYAGFANWDVVGGTVDILKEGDYGLTFNGVGAYVDLDGSTSNAGALVSKTAFALDAGSYILEYQIAGNMRGRPDDTVIVSLGSVFTTTHTLASTFPVTRFHHEITVSSATTANLKVEDQGGDNYGAMFDDVMLCQASGGSVPTPELGTLALVGAGVVGLALLVARRR